MNLDKVFFHIFDDDFGVLEEKSSDEDDNGIGSYLGMSRIYHRVRFSMGREVMPDLPSRDEERFECQV